MAYVYLHLKGFVNPLPTCAVEVFRAKCHIEQTDPQRRFVMIKPSSSVILPLCILVGDVKGQWGSS